MARAVVPPNQAGQLVKRTDPMANVTCYNYDALQRNTHHHI